MDYAENALADAIRDRLNELETNAFAVEKKYGLPEDSIRSILKGGRKSGTSINRAQTICAALGLELYIGPPRETGTVYTTNRRVWEHDKSFKKYLRRTRCMGIDMETATIFITGFANRIPTGALLLVSDQPMVPEGVKTDASDRVITDKFVDKQIDIGIDSLREIRDQGQSVRHLRFD